MEASKTANQSAAPNNEGAAAKPGKRGLRPWLLLGLIAAAAGAAGFAAVSIAPPGRDQDVSEAAPRLTPQESDSATNAVAPVILELESIVVNVANSEGRRYLKATLAFELKNGQIQATLEDKIKKVQLMDLLNSCLSSKGIGDLDGEEKRNDLRREIRDDANLKLGLDNGIVRVYFTEFIIQ